MIAGQLLYTSWKNGESKIKGYMVYSKSADITAAEETEICAVMRYKAPDNLPYTPSDEEIDSVFPKIFAYFKLSSGRYCIAQSSYVGQDYSRRWGNYIIHAYVFDDIGDLIPSRMIGTNIFRTRLTEKELNADFAPEFLPKIDLENCGNVLTESEIKQFFGSIDRQQTLKALAQSVLCAVLNNKRINFIDDLPNMRTWITALSMIVPKKILNRMYFSTYAIDNYDLITLSCKQSNVSVNTYEQSYMPDYLINIDAGRNEKNIVSVGCYIYAVCNKLFDGYYDGILCANKVNKTMSDYECDDYDFAYKLAYIKKGEMEYIESDNELLRIIELIAKHETEDLSEICDRVFVRYANEMYSGDTLSNKVFKALYPYLSKESRIDLLTIYADKKLEHGGSASSVYAEIKRDCPCEWNEAVMCFLRQSFMEHFGQNLSDAAALLLCNSWIDVYNKCNDIQRQRAFEQICDLYAIQVASRDIQSVICVLDACKNVDGRLYTAVYKSVVDMIENFGEDDGYLFDYLKLSFDKGDLFWYVLINELIRVPSMKQVYIKRFIALREKYVRQVDELMKYAENNPPIRQFVDNVNIYIFENTQIDNLDDLINCYVEYIANSLSDEEIIDKCREIFLQKTRLFLGKCDGKDSIKYSISLYDKLYRGKEIIETDKDIINLLAGTIYNDNKKDIAFIRKCLLKTPFETIVALMNACRLVGVPVYPRALLMYEGYYFERAAEKDGNSAKRVVREMFYENRYTFVSMSYSEGLLKEFLDSYIDVMLKGMYMIYNADEKLDALEIIDYFLVPVSTSYRRFAEDMLQSWKRDVVSTNENMDMYFLYIFKKTNAFRNELNAIVEEYLVRIGKGKRNALFEKLTDYFKGSNDISCFRKTEAYIKEFNKNHVSFFDKINSIFSGKEKDKNNGRKK